MNKSIENINIDTKARDEILSSFGQFMDLDTISKNIFESVPNTSSEMKYRIELRWNFRVWLFITFFGFLLYMSVIMLII